MATEAIEGMQAAVSVLFSKWSVAILAELANGTHRFNELVR
jgi:DNA-binding HxlR family transcriptional regulator